MGNDLVPPASPDSGSKKWGDIVGNGNTSPLCILLESLSMVGMDQELASNTKDNRLQFTFRTSELPEEEKERILFVVFDTLLSEEDEQTHAS